MKKLLIALALTALAGCGNSEKMELEKQRLELEKQKLEMQQQELAGWIDTTRRDCIDNLKQIEGAKQTALIQGGSPRTLEDLRDYFAGSLPVCPAGGTYSIGNAAGKMASCSKHGSL